jgi:hypothetical protein
MTRLTHLPPVTLIGAAFGLVVVGCGHPGVMPGVRHAQSSPATLRAVFRSHDLRLRYPSGWRTAVYGQAISSFSGSIVYVSNQRLNDPCVSWVGGKTCNFWAVKSLRRAAAILQWTENGFPGWSLQGEPGRSVTIDGRPSRELIMRLHGWRRHAPGGRLPTARWYLAGLCRTVRANELVAVFVASHVVDNWYQFTACLRGPNLARLTGQALAVLKSTRLTYA